MNRLSSFEGYSFPPAGQWVGYGDGWPVDAVHAVSCQWEALRKQLLLQWARLTSQDLDKAGPRRDRLAALIQNKYGINARLAENYLRNFERILPLM